MIKILHFVSKMDRAGQETFIMNVYRNIDKSKFQFSFLCTDSQPGDYDDEIRELGGNIYILPQNAGTSRTNRYLNEIKTIQSWLADNKSKFDIVHLHTYHALDVFVHLEACRRANVHKVVIHSHNTDGPHHIIHFFFRHVDNLYNCTRFACAYDAGCWLYGLNMMKKGKVKVIYNGIAPQKYLYDCNEKETFCHDMDLNGKTIVGHIGRFNQQKNHSFLLDVFKEYTVLNDNAVLLLIGRGELETEVREKVKRLELIDKVVFMGVRDDVPRLLSAMDLLVFPSFHEGLSVVLVEAQAAGLKCVVSDNIIPKEEEVVEDIFDKVSLSEKATYWARQMQQLLEKPIDRLKCNKLINESNFNIANTVKTMEIEYLRIYNDEK